MIHCTVKEVEVNKKLVFTWNPGIDAETLVSILISEKNGQTDITLIHTGWENLPAEMRPQLSKITAKAGTKEFVAKIPDIIFVIYIMWRRAYHSVPAIINFIFSFQFNNKLNTLILDVFRGSSNQTGEEL